jgi:hypothetical protein
MLERSIIHGSRPWVNQNIQIFNLQLNTLIRIPYAGFQSSLESRESTDVNTNLHPILPNVIACSYLDATNEFSDIPVIEGSLSINDVSSASRMNEALLRWKDISDKVEVRVFSVKTLFRGFSDISVIPEVKSSFFGALE